MTNTKERTVVVIGAGVAGLAAARQLILDGIQVIILEKDSHIGGRVHTDVIDGFEIETGAQFMVKFYVHTRRLIHELGLQDDVVNIPGRAGILRAGHLYKVWPPNPILLFTNLISFRSKLLLIKIVGPLLHYWQKLDIHALYKAHQLDTCSIAEYVRQELDDELLEYMFQPPLTGIDYWTPEHTSQVMLFLLFKVALDMKLFTLRHGLGQFPEAIAVNLPVQCNAEVTRVTIKEPNSYSVEAYIDGQKRQLIADGIVCATPATMVSGLFPHLDANQRAFFEAINYSPTVGTIIGLDRRLPSDFYGIFFPRREAEHLAAAVIQSGKNPAQTPADRDLITLFSAGPACLELLDKNDAFIQAKLLAELRQANFFYDPSDHILFSRIDRIYQALPEFDVGHLKRLKTFVDGEIESGCVVFAGDYIGGPFIEGAVTSGLEAAQRLLKRLN